MHTTRLAPKLCPYCEYNLDAATASPRNPHAVPMPGDVTVCARCANVLIFDDSVRPRRPTVPELTEVLTYPDVLAVIQLIQRRNGL